MSEEPADDTYHDFILHTKPTEMPLRSGPPDRPRWVHAQALERIEMVQYSANRKPWVCRGINSQIPRYIPRLRTVYLRHADGPRLGDKITQGSWQKPWVAKAQIGVFIGSITQHAITTIMISLKSHTINQCLMNSPKRDVDHDKSIYDCYPPRHKSQQSTSIRTQLNRKSHIAYPKTVSNKIGSFALPNNCPFQ